MQHLLKATTAEIIKITFTCRSKIKTFLDYSSSQYSAKIFDENNEIGVIT